MAKKDKSRIEQVEVNIGLDPASPVKVWRATVILNGLFGQSAQQEKNKAAKDALKSASRDRKTEQLE